MVRTPSFIQNFNVGSTAGWELEDSGGTGVGTTLTETTLECAAGGFTASNHYARIRRTLPETDNAAPSARLTIDVTFFLPADFYTQIEGTFRIWELNNTNATDQDSVQRGTTGTNEWRLFLSIHNGSTPRLVSRQDVGDVLSLWTTGTQLAAGQTHRVKIDFAPSQGTAGSWAVDVNEGEQVASASGIQTVPAGVAAGEAELTRILAGISSAGAQDANLLKLNLDRFDLTAWVHDNERLHWGWANGPQVITTPVDPPVDPTVVPTNLFVWDATAQTWRETTLWYRNGAAWDELEPEVRYYSDTTSDWET